MFNCYGSNCTNFLRKEREKMGNENQTKRVLSIDGGGIRGIIPATILAQIEKSTKKPIYKQFDLIVGTSTGGLLALILTAPVGGNEPVAAEEVVKLYETQGKEIFPKTNYVVITGLSWLFICLVAGTGFAGIGSVFSLFLLSPFYFFIVGFCITGLIILITWILLGYTYNMHSLIRPKYNDKGLTSLLQDKLESTRLKEAKTNLLITSYDIERRKPHFFRSFNTNKSPDFYMRDVARATSAAPTFFRPAKIKAYNENGNEYYTLVDGGIVANNPAMCAYVEAKKIWPDSKIELLSIGTGEGGQKFLYEDAVNWGTPKWISPLLECMFDGTSDATNHHLKTLMRDNYTRLQIVIEPEIDTLDKVNDDIIRKLKITAQEMISELKNRTSKYDDFFPQEE